MPANKPALADCHRPRRGWRAVGLLLSLSTLLPTGAARAFEIELPWAAKATGPVLAEARNVGSFSGVQLATQARVEIRPADRDSVEVRGEASVVPLISTRVENGVLIVEDQRSYRSSAAQVVVGVRQLSSLGTSGSSSVRAEGLTGPELRLRLSGSSSVSLKALAIGRLSASLGGSSALRLDGSARQLALQTGGSSEVRAAGLEADQVTLSGGGSTDAVLWAKQSLSVALGGSSNVRWYGTANASVANSGSSDVRRLGDAPPARQ